MIWVGKNNFKKWILNLSEFGMMFVDKLIKQCFVEKQVSKPFWYSEMIMHYLVFKWKLRKRKTFQYLITFS